MFSAGIPENSYFLVDSGYNLETCPQNFGAENKPPLTALGEVVELIGQPWNPSDPWTTVADSVALKDEAVSPASCRICCLPINDPFFLKIGETICHEQCARCAVCNEPLNERCCEKNNQFFCHLHYFVESTALKCAGCQFELTPTDMVYKLKDEVIYHVGCHRCYQCGRQLAPGEQIIVDEITKTVSCSFHQNFQVSAEPGTAESTFYHFPDSVVEVKPIPTKKEPKIKVKDEAEVPTTSNTLIPQYPFEMYAFGEMCGDDSRLMKRRGPRTTIKQSQLDVLNQIFSSTPKPSKHARAKLALETGLSMRVIQVWFQNRRSKERRLKHLCNFLRHYEKNGIVPPPFKFNPEDGTILGEPFSPATMRVFNEESSFSLEDDPGDLST